MIHSVQNDTKLHKTQQRQSTPGPTDIKRWLSTSYGKKSTADHVNQYADFAAETKLLNFTKGHKWLEEVSTHISFATTAHNFQYRTKMQVCAIDRGVLGGIRGYTPYANLWCFLTVYTYLVCHNKTGYTGTYALTVKKRMCTAPCQTKLLHFFY